MISIRPKLEMVINRKTQIAGAAAAMFLGIAAGPSTVFGLGLAVPDQDAFATARGNAFVATANDPSAVFYNPAGISQLEGFNVSLGAYGIDWRDRYSSAAGSVDSKTIFDAAPQVFSTINLLKDRLTFGVGIYSPYGLRSEWPTKAPFLQDGETGQITYARAAGTLAWQITPSLSVAAGPNFDYSEADIKEFATPVPFLPGFVNHFRGRATSVGYEAGILFHPGDQHYFGLTYRSATEMNYNGHATLPVVPFLANPNIAASADFHFPSTLVFGYSFRPNEKWNFESDLNWTDWSTLKTVPVVPLPEALGFGWKPSWMLDFGATRYLGDNWRVSGGYMYSENTVPDANFNPLVPDSDRHIFSLGVGKKCGSFTWDAAYQLGWGPARSVGGDTFASADGKYQFLSHALTINVGYHF